MTICYFGDFDPEYERNRVLIKGLRENGARVVLCNDHLKTQGRYRRLFKMLRAMKGQYDLIVVGYTDSRMMAVLACIAGNRPVVWDAFYSFYETMVFDKQIVGWGSPRAILLWLRDWLSCLASRRILLDTNEHIDYFVKTFHIRRSKFLRALIGADDSVFYPRPDPSPLTPHPLVVLFYGKFIPLQGVQYIIQAVKLLEHENIDFRIIGDGQTYDDCRELAQRIKVSRLQFLGRLPLSGVAEHAAQSDICLGIFGDTAKTQRVIPNKVYEAIAMKKAVISSDTPAARELFVDRKDIVLCKCADPRDLADAILLLSRDQALRDRIAEGGYQTYLSKATPKAIGAVLMPELEKLRN